MEHEFLDEDGRRVLARARDLVAEGESEGQALLKALLEERRSVALLLSVFMGAKQEILDLEPGVALDGLVRLAYEHAREAGVMIAGPEHLLIAAVRTSPRNAKLAQDGLTLDNLRRAAVRFRGGRNTNAAPGSVIFSSLVLLAQGMCCLCTMSAPVIGAAAEDATALVLVANSCWSIALSIYLGITLYSAEPTVWSITCGYQMARLASLTAAWVYGAVSSTSPEVSSFLLPPALLTLLPPALVAFLVFRERQWFDVSEREKWRTLWRKGGWAIVGTLVLDLSVIGMAQLWRRF